MPETPDQAARQNGFGQPSVNEAREHVTTPADLFAGGRASAVEGYDSGSDGKVNHEHYGWGSCVRDVRRRQPMGRAPNCTRPVVQAMP